MSALTVLLPTRERLARDAWLQRWLPRGDVLSAARAGRTAQLASIFQWPGTQLPAAALLREKAVGDAGQSTWLCADPSNVLVELNGARLMACGTLDISAVEADALARELRPLLGDRGFLLETTTPSRWQLRLSPGAKPPAFDAPDDALGDDLLDHLPAGEAGRPWRSLFTEVQVVLHNHAINAARRRDSKAEINALWFWGAGALPAWVRSRVAALYSRDPLALALASAATPVTHDPEAFGTAAGATPEALDLSGVADFTSWWPRIETAWKGQRSLDLVFLDGARVRLKRWHRWRVWRR